MVHSIFPSFKPIELQEKEVFEHYYQTFLPYSDFNFSSLYIWNATNAEFCFLNSNLVIKMDNYDYDGNSKIVSFLGQNAIDLTINTLFQITNKISLVPEESIVLQPNLRLKYEITEDEDNFDYIYSLDRIGNLKNSEYKKKRYSLKTFEKKYINKTIQILNLNNKMVVEEMEQLLLKWYSYKNFNVSNVLKAKDRFFRLIQLKNLSHFECIGIYVDNSLSGFSINEIVNEKYTIQHYMVTDWNLVGISDYLFYESIKRIPTQFLNNEQDGGLEGLRKFKRSWRPESVLKKYTITKHL